MLVTAAELSEFLKETGNATKLDAAIRVAEAAVAAFIGAQDLAERSVSETIPIPRDKSMVEVEGGPIVALSRLNVDGVDADLAEVNAGRWSIWYSKGFSKGSNVVADYTAGWTSTSVPEEVRAAILITAGVVWARPDLSISRATEADITYRYSQDIMTPAAKSLVRRWRRPR